VGSARHPFAVACDIVNGMIRWRPLGSASILAVLTLGGCHGPEDPRPVSTTLVLDGGPRVEAPKPSTAAATVVEAPKRSSTEPFAIVDLLDFQRRNVSRFAYSRSTGALFVSFSDRGPAHVDTHGDELQEWSIVASKRVHSYRTEPGWMFDELFPSPDGRYVVAALFRASHSSGRSEKFALLDTSNRVIRESELRPYNERHATVEFGTSGTRFRISFGDGPSARQLVYDTTGRPATADPSEFPPRQKGPLWVIDSTPYTTDSHGLYYTGADGEDHRVTPNHWHSNYALTGDGQYVVTTTWDGEILAWSTAEKKVVFREKIAAQYGFLAYDEASDRFLIADATSDGTTHLRALLRGGSG